MNYGKHTNEVTRLALLQQRVDNHRDVSERGINPGDRKRAKKAASDLLRRHPELK